MGPQFEHHNRRSDSPIPRADRCPEMPENARFCPPATRREKTNPPLDRARRAPRQPHPPLPLPRTPRKQLPHRRRTLLISPSPSLLVALSPPSPAPQSARKCPKMPDPALHTHAGQNEPTAPGVSPTCPPPSASSSASSASPR